VSNGLTTLWGMPFGPGPHHFARRFYSFAAGGLSIRLLPRNLALHYQL